MHERPTPIFPGYGSAWLAIVASIFWLGAGLLGILLLEDIDHWIGPFSSFVAAVAAMLLGISFFGTRQTFNGSRRQTLVIGAVVLLFVVALLNFAEMAIVLYEDVYLDIR